MSQQQQDLHNQSSTSGQHPHHPPASLNNDAPTVNDDDKLFTDFKTLFKRKNANVKRYLTMSINAIKALEAGTDHHDDDIAVARRHVRNADNAVESLNQAVDEVVEIFDYNRLEPFTAEITDHVPSIMDIRARIRTVERRTQQHNPQTIASTPSTSATAKHKIDTTFRPEPLDKNATPSLFQEWRSQFDIYAQRNGFLEAPIKEQRVFLSQCLTPVMARTFTRVCAANEAKTMDELLDKIERFLLRSNNLWSRRFKYFNCLQQNDETIEEYMVRFREVGDYAGFETFSYQDNMACRLVTGIKDDRLRHELMQLKKKDFETISEFALSWEASKQNSSGITRDPVHVSTHQDLEVNKLSTYKSNKKSSFHKKASHSSQPDSKIHAPKSDTQPPSKQSSCFRCGYSHHRSAPCPAISSTCGYCKKIGHFTKVCLLAKKRQLASAPGVNQLSERNEESDSDQGVDDQFRPPGVNVVDYDVFLVSEHSPTPLVSATYQHSSNTANPPWILKTLPDTGAAVSVMPASTIRAWGLLNELDKTSSKLRSVGGDNLQCDGTITFKVTIEGLSLEVQFFVCPSVKTSILSWSTVRAFGLIPSSYPRRPQSNVSQVCHQSDYFVNLKNSFINRYEPVFNSSGRLKPMYGKPMSIYLKNNIDYANIKSIYKPRPIPVPLRDATKIELDKMVQNNIIKPVSQPTDFLSPMLVVAKKEGNVRLVIDYTELNKHIKRPIHPFPSVAEVRALIPSSSKYFATIDATQGYWQVPLDKNSQLMTTFLTPWGRFCFLRAPMGLSASGDEFCRRADIAFQGISGVIKVVDDLLIHASSIEQLRDIITQVLEAASKNSITLAPHKFNLGPCVDFVGLTISAAGITPDRKHLQAIADFPQPQNKTDLRSFFGLINQFSSFSKEITTLTKPLRPLLSKQTQWHWSDDHSLAFSRIRKLLVQSPILQYFSPHKQTKLLTDASKLHGLGFALLQKDNDKWCLVACGSRAINNTEMNYAACELEALAIVWAILKCRIYLAGLPFFTVVTDHRPLVSIFNASRLAQNDNPRLVRLLQKVSTYSFTVEWTPGKLHCIPDALSRSPITETNTNDDPVLAAVQEHDPFHIDDPSLALLATEAKQCCHYQDLCHAIRNSTHHDVLKLPVSTHGHLRAFSSIWDRLSIHPASGLVLLDHLRIVIPKNSVKKILKLAHASHQGMNRTKARLQGLYFWHGMSNDVTQMVQACNLCQQFQASNPKQPLSQHKQPTFPFQSVSFDLFDYKGAHTLVYVDRFSGWPLVAHFPKSPTTSQILSAFSTFFTDFGIPVSMRHDGARPLVSEQFKSFLHFHNIRDELSSAYNPQSNGHAEAAVKAVKLLVKKCWMSRQLDKSLFNNALLEWRNTPRIPGMKSPAELLFKKKLRTLLPALNYKSLSETDIRKAVKANYSALTNAYKLSNSRKFLLKPLQPGDQVRIRNTVNNTWDKQGVISSVRDNGLSYYVTSQDKIYLRNRKLLKKIIT